MIFEVVSENRLIGISEHGPREECGTEEQRRFVVDERSLDSIVRVVPSRIRIEVRDGPPRDRRERQRRRLRDGKPGDEAVDGHQ